MPRQRLKMFSTHQQTPLASHPQDQNLLRDHRSEILEQSHSFSFTIPQIRFECNKTCGEVQTSWRRLEFRLQAQAQCIVCNLAHGIPNLPVSIYVLGKFSDFVKIMVVAGNIPCEKQALQSQTD